MKKWISILNKYSITILVTIVLLILNFSGCIRVDDDTCTENSLYCTIKNAPENSVVYIPEGVFSISKGLLIDKSLTLKGAGKDKTILKSTTEADVILTVKWFADKSNYKVVIEGMTLDGINSVDEGTGLNPGGYIDIKVNNVKFINLYVGSICHGGMTFSNCSFFNNPDEGICIGGGNSSTKSLIENCYFENNEVGIEFIGSSYNIVRNCTFKDSTHAGIGIIGAYNTYNEIYDCTFIDTNVCGVYESTLYGNHDNLVYNCTFINARCIDPYPSYNCYCDGS